MIRYLLTAALICGAMNIHAQQPFGFPDNFHPEYFSYDFQAIEGTYLPGTVILKLKPEHSDALQTNAQNTLKAWLEFAGATNIQKKFPLVQPPKERVNAYGQSLTDLSLIYQVHFTSALPLEKILAEINSSGMVSYAQPVFIDQPLIDDPVKTLWIPNDTSISLQWYLDKIRAIDAWDLDTGNASVIIAVVDGGTNFSHPDLMDNIHYNLADPLNGIDDDNDGYIDNYRGWDVGDNDNNPQYIGPFNSAHGTAMCGLAAGSSNNTAAIAGVGYRCSYLPVKIVHSSFGWIGGYDGIVYAATHGAHIINCSWGGNTPQPYALDVITFAIVNHGCLVVAAAGNSNNTIPFYPASYEGVIAVGGTQPNDEKSGNSSFYEFVDVVAPGHIIYEPYATGYTYGGGTSDATAITSGGCGLIQSYLPGLTPNQVGALLTQSAYRVDTIPLNAPYVDKMGSGRIDIYNAFTAVQKPFIYFYSRTYSDGSDDIVLVNDTVSLTGNYLNYLLPSTAGLKAVLSASSGFVQIIDSVAMLGNINTLGFLANHPDDFRFVVLPGCPLNASILFKVRFIDGTDTLNTQYFTLHVNPQYYNLRINGLHTTITNTGKLGFFNNNSSQGVGYRMNGGPNQLLGVYYHPMGLWIGQNSRVSNQTIRTPTGPCCPYQCDAHFVEQSPIQRVIPAEVADVELLSHYNDAGAGISAIGIEVLQKSYAWNSSPADSNFIILEYQLRNTGASGLNDIYAGIYTDFDMPDSIFNLNVNQAHYNATHKMGVVRNPGGSTVAGIKVISDQQVQYYGFNTDGSGGSYVVLDGLSQVEKWGAMSNGIQIPATLPNDIAQYIGVKIDTIPPAGCATVVMALLIAIDSTELNIHASAALTRYNDMFNVWTAGGGDPDWHNPLNWSKGTVPSYLDYVIIPDTRSAAAIDPVISTTDAEARNVEIRCGGNLQVTNNTNLYIGQ